MQTLRTLVYRHITLSPDARRGQTWVVKFWQDIRLVK